MNPSLEDIRLGKMAALECLIATCESDISEQFERDDLSVMQNQIMQRELKKLWFELNQRRIDLICHKAESPPLEFPPSVGHDLESIRVTK